MFDVVVRHDGSLCLWYGIMNRSNSNVDYGDQGR